MLTEELIIGYRGLRLVKKRRRYFIRFFVDEYEELLGDEDLLCDLRITKKEAEKIISREEEMIAVFDEHKKQICWTKEHFVNSVVKYFMCVGSGMEETAAVKMIEKLDRHPKIKKKLYKMIMNDFFPYDGEWIRFTLERNAG